MITLPLLPRVVPRSPSPISIQDRKLHHHHHGGGLNTTQKIMIAVAASVVLLILIVTVVICAWQRKKRAAKMAPKDAMKSSSSSLSSISGPYPEPAHGGPRALENHLSPGESMMHDVPLSAGPKYGYGAQVDGLRIPSMTAKPSQVQYGYNQVSMSRFSAE